MNLRKFTDSVVFLASVLGFAVVALGQRHLGYQYLFLHPLLFAICFFWVFRHSSYGPRGVQLFSAVFTAVGFVRYVVLPVLTVSSGHYGGRSHAEPVNASYEGAILLMGWELIAITAAIAFFERRRKADGSANPVFEEGWISDSRPNIGYHIFLVIAVAMGLLFPAGLANINFLTPSDLAEDLATGSTLDNFVSYTLIVAKSLLFLLIAKRTHAAYRRSRSEIYVAVALLAGFLNTFTYWGTNRTDILIAGVASFAILHRLYGRAVWKYVPLGIGLLLVVLAAVSVHRESQTITRGDDALVDVTDIVQVYSGGPYNVAIAIETKEYFPEASDLKILAVDFLRPMIGVNLILKDLPLVYSNVFFNLRMWTHVDRRSQILPMVGQGNLYLGYAAAPMIGIFFVLIAYMLERSLWRTGSIEISYFVNLTLIRLGFMMGQNSMNLINDISMNLFLFFAVYGANRILRSALFTRARLA